MSTLSNYLKLKPVDVGAVRWGDGFWGHWFELSQASILPNMRKALDEAANGAVMSNFYIAAGLQEGKHSGTLWSDGDCYKWMEALAHVYGVTKDTSISRILDELIGVIAQAQEEDGYICTQIQLTERERWVYIEHHELYNMGHLMTAAAVHHRVTGQENFLNISRNLGNYLYDLFAPMPPELAHFGFNPSNIMGAIDLYRATGNEKYLELGRVFVEMRGSQSGGTDQNQQLIKLRNETKAVGHGVTAGYLYCGAADVIAETGDEVLTAALERIWHNIITTKSYITGSYTPIHHGASMRPEMNVNQADKIAEAFGYEYQLPNASAYNETCANIANAMFNWRMLGLTGEAKYADVIEKVIYNSLLSGMSLDGTHFCYTNSLRWHGEEQMLLSNDVLQRQYTLDCYCCPPNLARAITWMHNWVYSVSDNTVWVHLFGSSSLNNQLPGGERIKLTQTTNYPWEEAINFVIEEAPNFELEINIRIPQWAENAQVRINSLPVSDEIYPGAYLSLGRVWSVGDQIQVVLPMRVRMMKANHRVEEVRNQIAMVRGPIVYCLESVDLPGGVSVSEIHIDPNETFSHRFVPELLNGIVILEGRAKRIYEPNTAAALYYEVGSEVIEPIDIKMIPYYAWNNRGISQMSLWLPRI